MRSARSWLRVPAAALSVVVISCLPGRRLLTEATLRPVADRFRPLPTALRPASLIIAAPNRSRRAPKRGFDQRIQASCGERGSVRQRDRELLEQVQRGLGDDGARAED